MTLSRIHRVKRQSFMKMKIRLTMNLALGSRILDLQIVLNVTLRPLYHSRQIDTMFKKCNFEGAFVITDDVGNRIKYLRKQMGLSQEKFALKAEIDRTYLAGIESGKRNATIQSIEKIVNALEVTMKDFWDFDPYR